MPAQKENTLILGKYQLLEMIGQGAAAEVYKARTYGVEGFEKLLAIKRFLPKTDISDQFMETFIDEAKLAVTLNHANIAQVLDLGRAENVFYVAMELVTGFNLARIIEHCKKQEQPIKPEIAAYIASEMAKGLEYAHRRRNQNMESMNIIHRNLTPDNILVSFEGEIKITDFGLAKSKNIIINDNSATSPVHFPYAAPEQTLTASDDRRVDIFSLGTILYELVTTCSPFSRKKVGKNGNGSPIPVQETTWGKDVPDELCGIIEKSIQIDPGKRYSEAGEVYEALISFLYNAQNRVGAHSISDFINKIKLEIDELSSRSLEVDERLEDEKIIDIADVSIEPPPPSKIESQFDFEEVTETGIKRDSRRSSLPRISKISLSAENREVTVLVVKTDGSEITPKIKDTFTFVLAQGGGTIIEDADTMIAVFGIGMPNGKDTADAIDAGLNLQQALEFSSDEGAPFKIGVGIYPDELVVSINGVLAQNDAFKKAVAQASQLAEKSIGGVCTSITGRTLVENNFEFAPFTVTLADGFDQLLYKVVNRRAPTDAYEKYIGRKECFKIIGDLLTAVGKNKSHVLGVCGDNGLGKTRLFHEVYRRLEMGNHEVNWHETTCVPWRKAPFSAIKAIYNSVLAIGEIEPEDTLKEKIDRLRELRLNPEEIEAISVLFNLQHENEIGPEERSHHIRSALIRTLTSLAADKTTIFFWDDLHHADKESVEIISEIPNAIKDIPVVIAFASRCQFQLNQADDTNFTSIELRPLSEVESKRLAMRRIGSKDVPDDLLVNIAFKSTGNPLYIEEYVKALLANNIVVVNEDQSVSYDPDSSLVEMPKTLRGLVSAGIDRLKEEHKGLLQRAAIMGHRFDITLLEKVTQISQNELRISLLALQNSGFVIPISTHEYSFASDLSRDVVYQGVVAQDLEEIHLSIATAIEEMFADRIDEFVESLANHYQKGKRHEKAIEYLVKAGKKVASDYSYKAALSYYSSALDLCQTHQENDKQQLLDIYFPMGKLSVLSNMTALGLEKMKSALAIAKQLSDLRAQIEINRVTAELLAKDDKYDQAIEYFEYAIELAEDIDDAKLKCEVQITAGDVYQRMGDIKKSIPFYEKAISLIKNTDHNDLYVKCIALMAIAQGSSGQTELALKTVKSAEQLIDDHITPESKCAIARSEAQICYVGRELVRSVEFHQQALEIAKEYELKEQIAVNAHNLGDIYVSLGDYRKAFLYLRQSIEIATEIGYDILVNLNQIFLSFIDALKFSSHESLSRLEQALALANERNAVWEQLQVHYFLGRIYFEKRQMDIAQSHLEQSIRIGRAAENKIYETQALEALEQIKLMKNEQ